MLGAAIIKKPKWQLPQQTQSTFDWQCSNTSWWLPLHFLFTSWPRLSLKQLAWPLQWPWRRGDEERKPFVTVGTQPIVDTVSITQPITLMTDPSLSHLISPGLWTQWSNLWKWFSQVIRSFGCLIHEQIGQSIFGVVLPGLLTVCADSFWCPKELLVLIPALLQVDLSVWPAVWLFFFQ